MRPLINTEKVEFNRINFNMENKSIRDRPIKKNSIKEQSIEKKFNKNNKKNKNMGRIELQIVQKLKVYVITGLPYRHVKSIVQFHSNPFNTLRNTKKKIKKNKNRKIKRKNKNCPFLSISHLNEQEKKLINKALILAEKHDLPESFKNVLVGCLNEYFKKKGIRE